MSNPEQPTYHDKDFWEKKRKRFELWVASQKPMEGKDLDLLNEFQSKKMSDKPTNLENDNYWTDKYGDKTFRKTKQPEIKQDWKEKFKSIIVKYFPVKWQSFDLDSACGEIESLIQPLQQSNADLKNHIEILEKQAKETIEELYKSLEKDNEIEALKAENENWQNVYMALSKDYEKAVEEIGRLQKVMDDIPPMEYYENT